MNAILVPTDGSPGAARALREAARLAHGGQRELTLLAVVPSPLARGALTIANVPCSVLSEAWQAALLVAEDRLERLAVRLRQDGLSASAVVIEGDPASAIRGYAAANPAIELIVLARSGAATATPIGSVTLALLNEPPKPLLVVPPGGRAHWPRLKERGQAHLLVPLDGSASSDAALEFAARLARERPARLELLAVLPDRDAAPAPADSGYWPATFDEAIATKLRQHLLARAAEMVAAGLPARVWLDAGDPAQAVLRHSQQRAADLIVMGAAGYRPTASGRPGSTVLRVVSAADVPVLLVPAEMQREERADPGVATTAPQAETAALVPTAG